MNLIEELENEEISKLDKKYPNFSSGSLIKVSHIVIEGTRKRQQIFEGIVISKKNKGINSNFILRKISNNIGVERTFQTYSPLISKIEVVKKSLFFKSKLYFLRKLGNKISKIKKKLFR